MRIRDLPVQLNAYGAPREKYNVIDTLADYGNYLYQIYGVVKPDKIPQLLNTAQFQYWDTQSNDPKNSVPMELSANIGIDYDEGTRFKILLFDRDRERELWQFSSAYNKIDHQSFKINFDSWVKSVKSFTVIVTDGQAPHEYYFRISQSKLERE